MLTLREHIPGLHDPMRRSGEPHLRWYYEGVRVCTVFGAAQCLDDIRILVDAFFDLDPVVHIARNDYDPGERGMLLCRFDHRWKEKERHQRGGEIVDLKTVEFCQLEVDQLDRTDKRLFPAILGTFILIRRDGGILHENI